MAASKVGVLKRKKLNDSWHASGKTTQDLIRGVGNAICVPVLSSFQVLLWERPEAAGGKGSSLSPIAK